MANNYSQFSESIDSLTQQEQEWVRKVLGLDYHDSCDLKLLKEEMNIKDDIDLDTWPFFEWQIQSDGNLWLYSEEGYDDNHLAMFVQAYIRKFRPDYIFKATGSCTCSKPRLGEFGGWWLVVSKDTIIGGNTWDAAVDCVKQLENSKK